MGFKKNYKHIDFHIVLVDRGRPLAVVYIINVKISWWSLGRETCVHDLNGNGN